MSILGFNQGFTNNDPSNKDALSAFKKNIEPELTIRQEMTPQEISEVVSERIIGIIEKQFEETKTNFNSKQS